MRPRDVYEDADSCVEKGRNISKQGWLRKMLLGQEEGLMEGLARPLGVAILASPAGVRQAGPGGSSSQGYFLFGSHISRQPCYDTSIYQQQK